MTIILDLPAPPSVNRTRKVDWRAGRKFAGWTRAADALVLAAKTRQRDPIKLTRISRFDLHITISENHTKIDLDNGIKWLIDYLRRIELIEDDGPKHLRRLIVEWGEAPEGARIRVVALRSFLDARTVSRDGMRCGSGRSISQSSEGAMRQTLSGLREHRDALKEELHEAHLKIASLEDQLADINGDIIEDAINTLLDEVQRPTGSLNFTLPDNPRSSAALSRLFDCVNRNI